MKAGGLSNLTVNSIADSAGISRSTFYRTFPNVEAAVIQVILDASRGVMLEGREALDQELPFEEKLAAFMVYVIVHVPQNKWISTLLKPTNKSFSANYILRGDSAALNVIAEVFAPLLEEGRIKGELRNDLGNDGISEWMLRNIWSLMTEPARGLNNPEAIQIYISTYVLPSILRTDKTIAVAKNELDDILRSLGRIESKLPS